MSAKAVPLCSAGRCPSRDGCRRATSPDRLGAFRINLESNLRTGEFWCIFFMPADGQKVSK